MARKVTVVIPHYKTLKLTKLCLRLLRLHTDPALYHIIVVDNGSQDESTEYLRTVPWIELIERDISKDRLPHLSHATALEEGFARVETPYVLPIHTDTLVKRNDWLPFLLSHIEKDDKIAGVGSWKLEQKSLLERLGKTLEQTFKIGKQVNEVRYLRCHCALYRSELLRKHDLHFLANDEPAGKVIHEKLVTLGYSMQFLPAEILLPYVEHLNHATMILSPEFTIRKRTEVKGLKRIKRALAALNAEAILARDEQAFS